MPLTPDEYFENIQKILEKLYPASTPTWYIGNKNMEIIRNDEEVIITISCEFNPRHLDDLSIQAFDNSGNQIHLTPTEQERAEEILLEGLNT